MDTKNNLQEQLIEILKKCSDSYYNTGDYYILNDEEYELLKENNLCSEREVVDKIYDSLETYLRNSYPNTSYILNVGAKVRGEKVKLPVPLGSMTECKLGEMSKWLSPVDYCISDKLDGISCLIGYENGKLKIAYTRGDGVEGQDITRHILKLENCPNELNTKYFNGLVRGEIIIPKEDISKAINGLAESTKKVYKNGRNLCAGQLNAKDCDDAFSKYAHFVAYYIDGWNKETHEMFETLVKLGFETPKWRVANGRLLSDDYLMADFRNLKETGKYECDGIIVTQDIIDDDHKGFETGTLNPKSSRKFKISGLNDTFISTITNIRWQISKDFILKPVIVIEPVEHNGVTITNISGNNYRFLKDNDLRIGTKIEGKRSGDVIPQYVKTIEKAPEGKGFNLEQFLIKTPSGDEACLYEEEDVELVLDASDELALEWNLEAYIQKLLYFCTKLGVDFAGYGNIKRLVEDVLIPKNKAINYKELCLLSETYFENTIGVNGNKFYDSLHKKLAEATPTQLADACGCFGRGIGELKLNKIVDVYEDLPNDYNKIVEVEGWAEKSAEQYIKYYSEYEKMVKFLSEEGLWSGFKQATLSNKFSDVKVVFTGVRSKQLEDIIKLNGGKICSSCTKECNLVVTNNVNGSSTKLIKARERGVEIITLEEANKRFFNNREEVKTLNDLNNPLANALKL